MNGPAARQPDGAEIDVARLLLERPNSQELGTAVRLGLDLVVLILQDNAYGMIRWKHAVDDFTDFGMTFGNPDFVSYALAYGEDKRLYAYTQPPRTLWTGRSATASCGR